MKRLALAATAVAVALALPACASGVGGLARITVIDRTANRELPVYWKDGRAYVAGQPGNEYAVRIRNVAGEDLLAVVSVDGVNAISGETANASQSGYVLGSYSSMDVSGWRKNMQRTAAFYFTTLPDSYAARTGRPDDVGVIGVALFKRKPPEPVAVEPWRPMPFAKGESSSGAPAPAAPSSQANEMRDSAAKRAQAESPLGTGHGRQERNPAHWVEFERATPYPVETIAIYYDSTRNLVAQGVIRAAPRPRDPNPFPGFVPDPVSQYRSWHRPPGA
ncbi:MAG: hypothetical protein FIB05_00060 [Betaproteobacteria bacterium]|nr:hypothetical protein [Betaproteobacteria bacterium]